MAEIGPEAVQVLLRGDDVWYVLRLGSIVLLQVLRPYYSALVGVADLARTAGGLCIAASPFHRSE